MIKDGTLSNYDFSDFDFVSNGAVITMKFCTYSTNLTVFMNHEKSAVCYGVYLKGGNKVAGYGKLRDTRVICC